MELQSFISENKDYIDLFKKEGLKVVKYKDLLLVKNYYDKPLSFNDESDYWKMYCRGAIIDRNEHKVVCLPPVKSTEIKNITDEFTLAGGEIQHLLDGTMINLFYRDEWLLSTRGEIGGRNKWINNKSFKDMFNECDLDTDLLDRECSYSFVMKHKDNRNVSTVSFNELFLVETYRYLDGKIERVTSTDYPHLSKINNISLVEMGDMDDYKFKGYTIKEDNRRYKISNPKFERVKDLKPNMNNELLNYIELRKNGNLKEYLKYFPEHSNLFEEYRNKIHILSNELYNVYKNCFIFKNIEKKDIPYHLKPFVNDIHKRYLKDKEPTTWQDIKDYIHNLNSKRLVFALNYS